MESLTETHMEFIAKGYSFLIPLQWIRDIQGFESGSGSFPVLNWNELLGKTSIEEQEKYIIILTYKGITFGVTATQVIGLCEIEQEALLELKKPVRNQKNLFLKAAVVHKDAEKRTFFETESDTQMGNLAFILDPAILSRCLYQDPG